MDLRIAAAFLESEPGTAAADHGVDVEGGIGDHVADPWLGWVSLFEAGEGEAGFEHLAEAGDASVAGVVIGREGSGLEPAFGLEISEVFHGAAQGGLGLNAGAIDIGLDAEVFVVEHGVEVAFEADFVFDHDAAFQTPCAADDFGG